jgi:hypothetical protein|tara:strand:- start:390 stop:821 length:432 start_codon:yes stop_codon:yes gene_type:complete
MGQGPSSVNYNYVYEESKKKNTVSKKPKVSENQVLKEREAEKINNTFIELLGVLKYHTNMVSIDKNFILQNRLINEELDKKIGNLNKELINSKDVFSRDNEIYRQKALEIESLKRYNVSFKYANIGLFMVIVILMGIKFIKKK